jgi:hypothetical protein
VDLHHLLLAGLPAHCHSNTTVIRYFRPLRHLKAYEIDGAWAQRILAGKGWVQDRIPISALNC